MASNIWISCTYPDCPKIFANHDLVLHHIDHHHLRDDEESPMTQTLARTTQETMLLENGIWEEFMRSDFKALPPPPQQQSLEDKDKEIDMLGLVQELIAEDSINPAYSPLRLQSNCLGLTIQTIPDPEAQQLQSTSSNCGLEVIETRNGYSMQFTDGSKVEEEQPVETEEFEHGIEGEQFTSEELEQAISSINRPVQIRSVSPFKLMRVKPEEPIKNLSYWAEPSEVLEDKIQENPKIPRYESMNWNCFFEDSKSESMSGFVEQSESIELSGIKQQEDLKPSVWQIERSCKANDESYSRVGTEIRSFADLIPYKVKNRRKRSERDNLSPSKITLSSLLYPTGKEKSSLASRMYNKRKPVVTVEPTEPVEPETGVYYSYDFIIKHGLKRRGSADKPYVCPVPVCGKKYKNPNGMKYHARYGHSPRQEFPCTAPGCVKIYTTKHGLNAHRKIHSDFTTPANNVPMKRLKIRLPIIKVERFSANQPDSEYESDCSCGSSPSSPSRSTSCQTPEPVCNEVKPDIKVFGVGRSYSRIKSEKEPVNEFLLSREVMQDENSNDKPIPPSPSFLRSEYLFNSPKKQFPVNTGLFAGVRRKLGFNNTWRVGDKEIEEETESEKAQPSLYFFPQPNLKLSPPSKCVPQFILETD